MSRSKFSFGSFAVALLVVASFCSVGHALPSGALSCAAGAGAVCASSSSTHCSNPQADGTGGPLSDGTFEVLFDGIALTPGAEQNFDTQRDYELTLQAASSPNAFRGFLIRLGDPIPENDFPPRTTMAFTAIDTDNTQILSLCQSVNMVGGITHKDNKEKQAITTMIRIDERAVGMTLDVTVVVRNNADESLYYYSNYTMNALDVTSSPTMSPTNPDGTTNPPIAPSPGPTGAPVTSPPTPLPTKMPTVSSAYGALSTSTGISMVLGWLLAALLL